MANINERLLELGTRYLVRSAEEVLQLREFLARYSSGESTALKEIEVVAHRIRGSGAMFGFAALSDLAGKLEMRAVEAARCITESNALAEEFRALIDSVDAAVRDAQRERQ